MKQAMPTTTPIEDHKQYLYQVQQELVEAFHAWETNTTTHDHQRRAQIIAQAYSNYMKPLIKDVLAKAQTCGVLSANAIVNSYAVSGQLSQDMQDLMALRAPLNTVMDCCYQAAENKPQCLNDIKAHLQDEAIQLLKKAGIPRLLVNTLAETIINQVVTPQTFSETTPQNDVEVTELLQNLQIALSSLSEGLSQVDLTTKRNSGLSSAFGRMFRHKKQDVVPKLAATPTTNPATALTTRVH